MSMQEAKSYDIKHLKLLRLSHHIKQTESLVTGIPFQCIRSACLGTYIHQECSAVRGGRRPA